MAIDLSSLEERENLEMDVILELQNGQDLVVNNQKCLETNKILKILLMNRKEGFVNGFFKKSEIHQSKRLTGKEFFQSNR